MLFTTFVILSANLLFLPAQASKQCYFVDGSTPGDNSYAPCDPDADFSPCCANNKGNRSDICMSSGLCYGQDNSFSGFIYMNGCTDPTGMASECPHICPDETTQWGGGSKTWAWNVLQCQPGVYCCRPAPEHDTNCCSNTTALITTNIGMLLVSATATEMSTTGAATVTVTSSISAGTTQDANDTAAAAESDCPKDNSVVIGGAVGGSLGLALLASLGALGFMIKRRKDGVPSSAAPPYTYADGQYAKGLQSAQMPNLPAQELPSTSPRTFYEMHS
ncbi:hypothetical protein VMCG_00877 [Cytospora schulzeri]|uniref:Mid2 domain-containing protein n=1 Tax=Cytospora schulzeri TaxID=448051 RepID=A0A423X4W8_9PEZI|nr:hypothetical protein VMCG_00877 [Valsa malicola]